MRPFACVVLLFAAGCGSSDPAARLVGAWEGRVEGVEAAAQKSLERVPSGQLGDEQAQALAKRGIAEMLDKVRIEDEFRADGTCVSKVGPQAVDGTWKLVSSDGDTLVIERGPNSSSERKQVMLRFDGPDTFHLDTNEAGMKLVFKRKKQAASDGS